MLNYRALIIGIDDYKDRCIPDLKTAVNDARAMPGVITDKYYLSLYNEETKMEYVSSVERIGFDKGMQQGSLSLLCRQISRQFKVSMNTVLPMFEGLGTVEIEELGGVQYKKVTQSNLPMTNPR